MSCLDFVGASLAGDHALTGPQTIASKADSYADNI